MTKAKRGMIAPSHLFFIIFICRIVVSLTFAQTVTTGKMTPNILISIALAIPGVLLISIPVFLCIRKNKNPLEVNGLRQIYMVYFWILAGVGISRFAYFASTQLNPDAKSWFFAAMIAVFAAYAAYLGIEGIGRFSAPAFFLLVIAMVVVVFSNLSQFKTINLSLESSNPAKMIGMNIFMIMGNTTECVILLALGKRVNGKKIGPFILSISLAIASVLLLVTCVLGVLGDAAGLQSYPVYTLSQMARLGKFGRLDAIYAAFWIFAIFIKSAVLLYCASLCTKKYAHSKKCFFGGAVAFLVSIAVTDLPGVGKYMQHALGVLFLVFTFVIPLCTLFIKKKDKGDAVLEKF